MTDDQRQGEGMAVLGIDCAVQPGQVGLALGRWESGTIRVEAVTLGSDAHPPSEIAKAWLAQERIAPLLALDAPLGWPRPLGERLVHHRAGEALGGDPDELFNRFTDRFLHKHEQLRKKPLEVGADRIARTAYAALGLVGDLRGTDGGWPLPLCWGPGELWSTPTRGGVIEVYPAATLKAHGIAAEGYKGSKAQGQAARERVAAEVAERVHGCPEIPRLATRSDGLDAVLCLLAAQDFLRGEAMAPPTEEVGLEQEGWIWVRDPAMAAPEP